MSTGWACTLKVERIHIWNIVFRITFTMHLCLFVKWYLISVGSKLDTFNSLQQAKVLLSSYFYRSIMVWVYYTNRPDVLQNGCGHRRWTCMAFSNYLYLWSSGPVHGGPWRLKFMIALAYADIQYSVYCIKYSSSAVCVHDFFFTVHRAVCICNRQPGIEPHMEWQNKIIRCAVKQRLRQLHKLQRNSEWSSINFLRKIKLQYAT